MKKGLFISIEGPDGSGKSTQIQKLKKFLEEQGREAIVTREPGGTEISEKIRAIILDKNNVEMDYMTEALLYAASRAQHVAQVIKPALDEGKTIICDRFVDSSIAYQGYGRKLGDCVRIINEFAVAGCMPDITFFLKIDPSIGKMRIKEEVQDRLELEKLAFHNEVFRGYLELEENYKDRIIGIDANRSIKEISKDIIGHMKQLLNL
ncbi:dTMP kinase [Clostridium aminobutyricum]|uniref:Thymidylate kinase n=1 Tax=Clostridium aminobutyricum TaxID=33953 RepID=A0A939IK49_CLOAM|nr:dTMP kinase [Clostridium aminobutyricum]MBN7774268.1 dTMP kinase [Clostridium aminobutyricum]